jgi:hypothetical protein
MGEVHMNLLLHPLSVDTVGVDPPTPAQIPIPVDQRRTVVTALEEEDVLRFREAVQILFRRAEEEVQDIAREVMQRGREPPWLEA